MEQVSGQRQAKASVREGGQGCGRGLPLIDCPEGGIVEQVRWWNR